MPLYSNFLHLFHRLPPSRDSLVVNASIPPNPFFLAISCPDMVLGRRVRTELSLVNPGFNYLLGLEAILLAARGGKEIRARTQQRTQGYFLLLARGAAVGACVLTRTRARARAHTHTRTHSFHFISTGAHARTHIHFILTHTSAHSRTHTFISLTSLSLCLSLSLSIS